MAKKKKVRTAFRKNHETRRRESDWTRRFASADESVEETSRGERVSGKGALTRKRTLLVGDDGAGRELGADMSEGRVLSVHGLASRVQTADGAIYRCAMRGLLKSLAIDARHVVAVGDRVMIRPERGDEGFIERIEPRYGVLSRTSKGRQHVIVSNVDQLVIVGSAAEPRLKPNLIDRYLICAEKAGIRPLVCINKIDLIDPADVQPLIGVDAQMGYDTLLVSAAKGINIGRLRRALRGRESVIAGQSGVGKSSLLNAIETGFALAVSSVSQENQKGRHTTTAARLLPLAQGGYVVDTPGIRQFQLWDVTPEEVAGYYRDLRPYESLCRYPSCTHTHEAECAVKDAVADGRLDARRSESYCHVREGDMV